MMSPIKVLAFLGATLLILFSLTFLAQKGEGTKSDHINLGFAELKYPSAEKFLKYAKKKKSKADDAKKAIEQLGSEEDLDAQLLQMKYDTTYNKQDTTLKGLQVVKVEDMGLVQDGVRLIEFPDNNRGLFFPLWQKLEGISSNRSKVRAVHYGDSQIEGDRITAYVRDKFQTLFGGNGPGFIPLKPVYNQITVEIDHSDNWSRYAIFDPTTKKLEHGRYGAYASLSRFSPIIPDSMITDSSEVYTGWVTVGKSNKTYANARAFNVVKVHNGNCTQPTAIKVTNGGEPIVNDSLRTDGAYHTYDIRLGETPTELKIEFSGVSSPDFYGLTLDGNYGFNMDNVAMRGSGGTIFRKINFTEFDLMLDGLNTEFIIMEYGGNLMPYLETEEQAERNANWFKSQIIHVKNARPTAQVLVIGPSDMSVKIDGEYQTYPLMEFFISKLKNASFEAGAAYWDMYRAMGGENSMITWVEEYEWAGGDYTHFSNAGVKNISRLLVQALLLEYQFYKSQGGAQ